MIKKLEEKLLRRNEITNYNEIDKNNRQIKASEKKWYSKTVIQNIENVCGLKFQNFSSFSNFIKLLYEPTDSASLAFTRMLFGLCMVFDVIEERGLANIDLKWGDPNVCHFPLVHGMRAPSLPYMTLIYTAMWLGAVGITLGYHFKVSCALFVIPYWYVFILDKSYWNNHTYLFGIIATLFWATGANKSYSLDARYLKNQQVPFWNYLILRYQLFILYFMAGLKKFSREWLEGYAMTELSQHWVFNPFKIILTSEQSDFFVVHWFGFFFDLTFGILVLFEKTRVVAMLFSISFHLMNSRLFSIGMFPYVCLATMPLFCDVSWPRKFEYSYVFKKESGVRKEVAEKNHENTNLTEKKSKSDEKICKRQKFVAGILLIHVVFQLFLPYSHFVTKGYNNWVPGLYGYSWDMMMYSWDTVLIAIKIKDNENHRDIFLDPHFWEPNDRWSRHGDMVRQYAFCIEGNLEKLRKSGYKMTQNGGAKVKKKMFNISSNVSIYMDIWISLNGRFQQRLFDPNVDLLKAEWHPLKPVSYLMPLLDQFKYYRPELEKIQKAVFSWSNYTDVIFVADYPGMHLENYIDSSLDNVTLSVLEGEVIYEEEGCKDIRTIAKGGFVQIETGRFHKVKTTIPHPACYMYTFANLTKQQLAKKGIIEPTRKGDGFPIVKEVKNKFKAFLRAIFNIDRAVSYFFFDTPM